MRHGIIAAASDECNATRRLGDGWRLIHWQKVRSSTRAVRAVRNTRLFQTETRVVADVKSYTACCNKSKFLYTMSLATSHCNTLPFTTYVNLHAMPTDQFPKYNAKAILAPSTIPSWSLATHTTCIHCGGYEIFNPRQ